MALLKSLKNRLFKGKDEKEKQKTEKVAKTEKIKVEPKEDAIKTDKTEKSEAVKALYANILNHPRVTEKSAKFVSQSKYIFNVAPKTNKIEVAKAVQAIYGVKPVKVNIIKTKGKQVSFGRTKRISGRRKDIKKAVVTLPKGEKIDVYKGV